MNLDNLYAFVTESSKVLHLDASHSALRDKLQQHLAAQHRVSSPESGYYDYPTVQDVYGDDGEGQVVYSQGGKHTMANFKKGDEPNQYALSKHKPVKKAYVAESLLTRESEVTESIEVAEAALDANGRGELCLIKPCRGSMGYYTEDALKKTAAKGVFAKGTKMFIDHATQEERIARPEGSVFKQAAVFEGAAVWKDNGKAGPGLYAPIKAYSDFVPFINERAKDIGASVRGSIIPTGKIIDGVPEVQEFASALSVDFVTRAGAGGKLITVYESFRSGHQPEPKVKEGATDMEVKESDFKALQDQAALVPTLVTRLDRVEEANRRYQVRDMVERLVQASELPANAQKRTLKPYLSESYPCPLKDGKLDVVVLEAAVKESIKEEVTYLQENGVLRPSPVSRMGAAADPNVKEPTEPEILQEANRILSETSRRLSNLPVTESKSESKS